ncbi:MAG: hypothetical protein NC203_00610 [Firmicutes bacterium]|nr:hypothetical protein [[Eubacterium] siraeum]MCM1486841.1 hypothetical protein [Bacillota bacterium]
MYAYNKTSAAYDLNYFDTDENAVRKSQRRKAQSDHIKMHKTSVSKSGNWFKIIVSVACVTVLAFAMINCKAQISEISTEISSKSSELEKAQEENVRLQAQLDNMVTLGKVDEIATGTLGLQKTSKNQVYYVAVYDRSMVQAAKKETNVFVSLQNWFDGVLEYLGF